MKTLPQVHHQIDTAALKKFAQAARRQLREQIAAQLDRVLKSDSAELREKEAAIKELKNQITISSRESVIDRVAYIWFNRFCALRFMDVNRYTRMGTVSPAEGFTQPEILAEAKQGHIDESIRTFINEQRVFDLLDGRIISKDPQQEAYRLLLVAVCNYYNAVMPFLFEKIADYTELLMPDDLLSDSSILADMRNTLTGDSCRDVEVIGWLYQFYISEKKDEVFEDLKKNKKITPENIPAATQLFTPHWIVRYLVENSLGRLWMLNRPSSQLVTRMDHYITPDKSETDFLRVSTPEELKICDPACGSGHMLVYAFDLLNAIYEEEGYDPAEIPRLILENNLYGIEIDERAGALAAFALVMKAREKYRRFFSKPIQPNVCVLQNIKLEDGELTSYLNAIGPDLFTNNLIETLHQFREADNFGSLIRPKVASLDGLLRKLESKNPEQNIFLHKTHERVLQALKFAEYLRDKYHVVIANPPYMGSKGMTTRLVSWAKQNYPDSKSDLFAMFIERCLDLSMKNGLVSMVTMQSWMFLSSYESLRNKLLQRYHISTLVQIGYNSFPELNSKVVQACAFVLVNGTRGNHGIFVDLNDAAQSADKHVVFLNQLNKPNNAGLHRASAEDFKKIPGSPIAYFLSDHAKTLFSTAPSLSDVAEPRQGLITGETERFIRVWHEVALDRIGMSMATREEASQSGCKWFPIDKGGIFRKWYGNNDYVVNWKSDGHEIRNFFDESGNLRSRPQNLDYYFSPGITWTKVSSGSFSVRMTSKGHIFSDAGMKAFAATEKKLYSLAGLLNSKLTSFFLAALSETINFEQGNISRVPALDVESPVVVELVSIAREDWNSFETSWDFIQNPLLQFNRLGNIHDSYNSLREHWSKMTSQMQNLEETNNQLFIQGYRLQDELSNEVSLNEVTLSCNPSYRYGKDKSKEELETLLLSDTMKDLISYAVGCMFGRFALEKPGLVLAHQGGTKADYLGYITNPSFPADDDNVIPILDADWFSDDISERFRNFIRVTFGDEQYQENLQFIETALGKDIRKYFLKDFYADHVRRYKKRPIYWLFSSPKGTFNALIYMHRYRPDTVSVILNDYLREFRNKLAARKSHLESVIVSASVSPAEKTKAVKEIEALKKNIDELDAYERDILYPLAAEKVQIELDDGVKVNYGKFGKSLKPISGMASEEE